jgi:hypothetical protein
MGNRSGFKLIESSAPFPKVAINPNQPHTGYNISNEMLPRCHQKISRISTGKFRNSMDIFAILI